MNTASVMAHTVAARMTKQPELIDTKRSSQLLGPLGSHHQFLAACQRYAHSPGRHWQRKPCRGEWNGTRNRRNHARCHG